MRLAAAAFLLVTLLPLAPARPSTPALTAQGETIVVISPADSDSPVIPGTLRWAMEEAQSGDTITFDAAIFPPGSPVAIPLACELPHLHIGNLTIDASNAGVILDGTAVSGEWTACLQIVNSDANTIQGLQVSNFSGPAVAISGDAQYNVIGGDRSAGVGPFGQGNLFTHNDAGVVLSTVGTSLNTVTGNLIGTDATGVEEWGNVQQGIWITGGTTNNIIGPDNVIAHNGKAGIEVYERETVRHTITRNSIHDNGWQGIDLWGGNDLQGLPLWAGNHFLAPPTIFDFDLQAGTVTGTACRYCTVEVFSDSGDEGAHLEGQTTADGMGVFALSKGSPILGPHLTATATDLDGNTSEFSLPTLGKSGSLTLQDGNGSPALHLQTRHSSELLDNRLGRGFTGLLNPGTSDHMVFYSQGAKRARVSINHMEPEYVEWERPEDGVPPEWDAAITRMADNGLKIKYQLTFWDKATWPKGEGAPCPRFEMGEEEEIERYLEFVQFIVHHFKDRIEYYEMWNEPDIWTICPKWIKVDDYINLVERTVPVIREEYGKAKIVVGAVSGPRYSDAREYLFALLESDIMPLVDAVSWHAMYGTSPECEHDYYYEIPSMVQDIKDVAGAHGFDGEYMVDELSWWSTRPPGGGHECQYSPKVAAKYASRGIVMHLGMDITVTLHEVTSSVYPNLCAGMAGALPADLPVQIQSTAAMNIVSYTFSLPNGMRLVALWTNGAATEYDPGTAVTVAVPGLLDHRVTGIDVLHGFEQPVLASEEDGNLVIHDLLVKDYPIILRLSPTQRVFLPTLMKDHPQ